MSSQVLAPTLVIRTSCSDDVNGMLPLMRQLRYPTTPSVLKEHLSMLDNHPLFCNLVAELDGNVVGTTFLKLYQTHDMKKPVTQITAMVVDEEHRGTGIGKRLLREAETWCKQHGSSQMYLSTGDRNMDAKTFYEHLGFICTGYRLSKTLS
ncbi:GNAT family N-acetyltransferase [Paenibacillus segetis]|uniref:N-acetyltransferase n=1 Tax=Paenibacillus segetis TaxID=1325360 RepID=A0ABQ1YFX3_9BACL|nr:GNAT family N-acetyltransferase [Paenibacillus segetis]GGH23941.1 N-acetyltransferase [Paenibacillus segetis]